MMKLMRVKLRPRLKLKRKTAVKLGVGVAVVALIAGAVVFTMHKLNSPAYGTILQQPTLKPITVKPGSSTPHIYSGQYFSFTIPSNFNINPSQESSGHVEVVKLISNDHTSKLVAITVGPGSLSNDPGISYRRANPAIYKEQSTGQGSLIFTKKDNGTEYTGYMTHNDLEASISISSSFTNDLSADYKNIAKSWQWK